MECAGDRQHKEVVLDEEPNALRDEAKYTRSFSLMRVLPPNTNTPIGGVARIEKHEAIPKPFLCSYSQYLVPHDEAHHFLSFVVLFISSCSLIHALVAWISICSPIEISFFLQYIR